MDHRAGPSPESIDLAGLTRADLIAAADRLLGPDRAAGAAKAIHAQVFRQWRFAPEDLGLLPANAAAWRRHFHLRLPPVVRQVSEPFAGPDGLVRTTVKRVVELSDGAAVECVALPMGRAKTALCVSSQVGCRMGCRFCETGRMGLLRHLTAGEIVSQVLATAAATGAPPRTIVFMGMGEALDNFAGWSQAVRVLMDQAGLHYSQDRLTLCTAGHGDGLRQLAGLRLPRLGLALSLNAAEDELRSRLMPANRVTPLAELKAAILALPRRPNHALGVNYCLMPGINDGRDHAAAVARFIDGLGRVLVHLIPYNPGHEPLTRAPEESEIEQFVGWLREDGVAVRRRVTKGRSVMAACGQLGDVTLRGRLRAAAAAPPASPPASPPTVTSG